MNYIFKITFSLFFFQKKIADGILSEQCFEDVKSSMSEKFNKIHCVTKMIYEILELILICSTVSVYTQMIQQVLTNASKK